ncbi:hypothetical protein ACI2KD_11650 [Pseudomonas monteilii]
MNDKKITTMIFKTLNYTNEIKKQTINGHGGRRQLHKSLRHSLRIPASQPKKLEWFAEQSHLNLIWLPDTGTINLVDFSKAQREALLARIIRDAEAPTLNNDNRSALLELRTKLKNKIKNASKQESDEATLLAFQKILNVKGVTEAHQLLANLGKFDIKRKSQKLSTARQFLDCHNEIERGPKLLIKKNQAIIHEAFFKFPSINQVRGLTAQGRINLIRGFYEALFPEYLIYFVVLHRDEDVDLTDYSDHPHIFISTRNSKTGRYDMREKMVNTVNSYLKKHRPATELISETPDFLESQLLFGYFQDMFYAYTNNKLLNNTPYHAKKKEKTESHMNMLRNINTEAKKPKSERAFNLYTLAEDKREEAVRKAELAVLKANKAQAYIHQAKQYVKAQMAKAENANEHQRLAEQATVRERERAEAYRRRSSISQQTIDRNTTISNRIQEKINSQTNQLRAFELNLSELVDGIVNWIDECFSKKRKDIQDKYLEQANLAYNRILLNDNTDDKSYAKTAEAEINKNLSSLEEYKKLFPDTPDTKNVKHKIISPKVA